MNHHKESAALAHMAAQQRAVAAEWRAAGRAAEADALEAEAQHRQGHADRMQRMANLAPAAAILKEPHRYMLVKPVKRHPVAVPARS